MCIEATRVRLTFLRVATVVAAMASAIPAMAEVKQGSGVLIGQKGHVLTNRHVIDGGCKQLRIEDYRRVMGIGQLVEYDQTLDVALISTNLQPEPRGRAAATVRNSYSSAKPVLGEPVHVAGFPNSAFAIRGGLVNAGSDPVHGISGFTIGLASYFGASGGPVFGDDGNLIGLVWGRLDSDRVLKLYALKMEALIPFIRASGADWTRPSLTNFEMPLSENYPDRTAEIAGRAIRSTVKILCEK